jgi:hypothetical protein
MWDLWWTKWRWGWFSPSTSVSSANLHSTNFSSSTQSLTTRIKKKLSYGSTLVPRIFAIQEDNSVGSAVYLTTPYEPKVLFSVKLDKRLVEGAGKATVLVCLYVFSQCSGGRFRKKTKTRLVC